MAPSDVSIGFFDALTGLLTEPGATVRRLFSHERPPHVLGLFVVLLFVLLAPIVWYSSRYEVNLANAPHVFIIVLISTASVCIFTIFQFFFLRGLGVPLSFFDVVGLVTYSLTPISVVVTLTFLTDQLTHGRLVLLAYLLNSGALPNDTFLTILPLVLCIAILAVLLVFYYGLVSAANLSRSGAFFITGVSLAPLSASIGLACFLVQLLDDRALKTVNALFRVILTAW